MKLTIESKDFADAVKQVSAAIPRQGRDYAGYHKCTDQRELRICFFLKRNGDFSVSRRIAADIQKSAGRSSTAPESKALANAGRQVPRSRFQLARCRENRVMAAPAPNRHCFVMADQPEPMELGEGFREFTITGEDFRAILDPVMPAISTEDARYYLNGIFFHQDGDNQPRSQRTRISWRGTICRCRKVRTACRMLLCRVKA